MKKAVLYVFTDSDVTLRPLRGTLLRPLR